MQSRGYTQVMADWRLIKDLIGENIPVVIIGPPGVGKTAGALALAESLGLEPVYLNAGGRQPEEFAGYHVDTGEPWLVHKAPAWVGRVMRAPRGALIIIDEFGSVGGPTQAALLSVVQERRVGEVVFPPATRILALANPPEIAAGGEIIPLPSENRFAWVKDPGDPAPVFAQGLASNWGRPWEAPHHAAGAALVGEFLTRAPEYMLQVPDAPGNLTWPSPRSWTAVSRIAAKTGLTRADIEARAALIIGEAAAAAFGAWLRDRDLADPAAYLADPGLALPTEEGKLLALLHGLIALDAPDTREGIWRVLAAGLRGPRVGIVLPVVQEYDRQGQAAGLTPPEFALEALADAFEGNDSLLGGGENA